MIIKSKYRQVYVLWSGGLDSTYMIQSLLDNGEFVEAGYVEVMNNERKTQMELKAISRMVPIFNKKYPGRFEYCGVVYKLGIQKYTNLLGLVQMPWWISAFVSTANQSHYKLAIGYVMNDCAISFLTELQNIWKAYTKVFHHRALVPKLVFPLSKLDKDSIAKWIDADLRKHVVWCEQPQGRQLKQCGTCHPCKKSPINRRLEHHLEEISVFK